MATVALFAPSGSPLTGQESHLSWSTYRKINDGGADTGPAFDESAIVAGEYIFAQDPAYAGIIDCTATTSPSSAAYLFIPGGFGNVFAVFDLSGAPVAGLSLTGTFANVANDAVASVSVDELGGGLYIAAPDDPTITVLGTIDTGAGHNPRWVSIQVAASAVAPSIGSPSPVPPGPIAPSTSLIFVITPGTADPVTTSWVAQYPDGSQENINVPGTFDFEPAFSNSTAVFTSVGTITVVRNAGWSQSPTFVLSITDAAGLTGSATFSWTLVVVPTAPVASTTLTPSQRQPSGYGSDMRVYMIQPDGTRDWDPYMLIIDDAAVNLGEMVLRRLSIPRSGGRSALFYDNNTGFDLHQFLNASISSNQRVSIQIAIAQEIEKDDRIESATAVIDPIAAAGMMVATINAVAKKGGVFRFVVAIDAVTVQLLNYQQVAA